jgi:cell division septation protein DedD
MSNALQTLGQGSLPSKKWGESDLVDDILGGTGGIYPNLSIRGSKWRVKFEGEEEAITNAKGHAEPALEVVLVRANPKVSKRYFQGEYEDGDGDSPVCFSHDGVKPHENAQEAQSDLCAMCPHNKRGSKIAPSGAKIKACGDYRRVVVVPYPDIDNEVFGGAALLRVPAASLSSLGKYGRELKSAGWNPYQVVTELSFDTEAAYPKINFAPVKPVEDKDIDQIKELRDSDHVAEILFELSSSLDAGVQDTSIFKQPETEVADTPAPVETVTEKPKAAPPKPPAKEEAAKKETAATPADGEIDGALDDLLSGL